MPAGPVLAIHQADTRRIELTLLWMEDRRFEYRAAGRTAFPWGNDTATVPLSPCGPESGILSLYGS